MSKESTNPAYFKNKSRAERLAEHIESQLEEAGTPYKFNLNEEPDAEPSVPSPPPSEGDIDAGLI